MEGDRIPRKNGFSIIINWSNWCLFEDFALLSNILLVESVHNIDTYFIVK